MSGKNPAGSVKSYSLNNIFYGTLVFLIILNSYLLSSPNLVGRLGVIYYGYAYLRSFPRILVTLTLLSAAALAIDAFVQWMVRRQRYKESLLVVFYAAILLVLCTLFISLCLDVRTSSYRHTGFRFISGILMIPWLLIFIFAFRAFLTHQKRRRGQSEFTARDMAPEENSTIN